MPLFWICGEFSTGFQRHSIGIFPRVTSSVTPAQPLAGQHGDGPRAYMCVLGKVGFRIRLSSSTVIHIV